jgi:hypothetical protein
MDTLLKTKLEVQESFNKIILNMCDHMAKKYPNTYFGIYHETAVKFIKERPSEPIAYFIKYVYSNDEYREKILAQDETYFMNQNYSEVPQDSSVKIFEIKELWTSLDDTTKKLIKLTFKHLADRTKLYVDILSDINKFKK